MSLHLEKPNATTMLTVGAIGIAVMLATVFLRQRQPLETVFLVPNNFQGLIRFRRIAGAGPSNTPQIWTQNEVCYLIPQSGDAMVHGTIPLTSGGAWSAEYRSGERIPTRYDMTPDPSGFQPYPDSDGSTIAFWTLASEGDGTLWCFVGTRKAFLNVASKGSYAETFGKL